MQLSFNLNGFLCLGYHGRHMAAFAMANGIAHDSRHPISECQLTTGNWQLATASWQLLWGLIVLVDILSNNANKYTITHSSESKGGPQRVQFVGFNWAGLFRMHTHTHTLCDPVAVWTHRLAACCYPCLKDFHLFKCALSKMAKWPNGRWPWLLPPRKIYTSCTLVQNMWVVLEIELIMARNYGRKFG